MIQRFLKYLDQYRKYTVLAIFCIVAESMVELIIPLIMADIVDVGVAYGNKAYILQKGVLMVF